MPETDKSTPQLPCGHHESNRDLGLESKTHFCRLCELQDRVRDAEGQEIRLTAEVAHLRRAHAALVAALKLAQKEIGTRKYVAGCVDDGVSPELRRLRSLKSQIDAALKLAGETCSS